jgi:hypothetical protein
MNPAVPVTSIFMKTEVLGLAYGLKYTWKRRDMKEGRGDF